MFKINNKDTRKTPMTLTLNMFTHLSSVSIVDFKQLIVSCERTFKPFIERSQRNVKKLVLNFFVILQLWFGKEWFEFYKMQGI